MILATTAAGHKLTPTVFVKGKATALSTSSAIYRTKTVRFMRVDGRWVNQKLWAWYIGSWAKAAPRLETLLAEVRRSTQLRTIDCIGIRVGKHTCHRNYIAGGAAC